MASGCSTKQFDCISLPLMGIGNGDPLGSAVGDDANLITPHGDRKRVVADYRDSGQCRSLPLMGIGNTPSRRWGARGMASHYPSWGSET